MLTGGGWDNVDHGLDFHPRVRGLGSPRCRTADGEESTLDIYSLGLLVYLVLTQKHPFDPILGPIKSARSVSAGLNVQLPGVKPELFQLIKSMVAVKPEERLESAMAVFDEICRNGFGLFEGVVAVAIRAELARFGVEDKHEPESARLKRENLALRTVVEPLKRENGILKGENAALKDENAELRRLLPASNCSNFGSGGAIRGRSSNCREVTYG
jgi:serine/threonine protein kinase